MSKIDNFEAVTKKSILTSEFPSYIRKQALENTGNLYCIIDIAKDEKLYPYLKHGDWQYYWLNQNWKQLDDKKAKRDASESAPCLITLNPRKMTVRQFIEDRLGKELLVIFESSASRKKVTDYCLNLLKTDEEEDGLLFYTPAILRDHLSECSDEEKHSFFKYFDRVWVENDDESVLEYNKKLDENVVTAQPVIEKKKEKKKEKKIVVIGDWMSSITDKKETKPDNNLSGRGFGVMGDLSKTPDDLPDN